MSSFSEPEEPKGSSSESEEPKGGSGAAAELEALTAARDVAKKESGRAKAAARKAERDAGKASAAVERAAAAVKAAREAAREAAEEADGAAEEANAAVGEAKKAAGTAKAQKAAAKKAQKAAAALKTALKAEEEAGAEKERADREAAAAKRVAAEAEGAAAAAQTALETAKKAAKDAARKEAAGAKRAEAAAKKAAKDAERKAAAGAKKAEAAAKKAAKDAENAKLDSFRGGKGWSAFSGGAKGTDWEPVRVSATSVVFGPIAADALIFDGKGRGAPLAVTLWPGDTLPRVSLRAASLEEAEGALESYARGMDDLKQLLGSYDAEVPLVPLIVPLTAAGRGADGVAWEVLGAAGSAQPEEKADEAADAGGEEDEDDPEARESRTQELLRDAAVAAARADVALLLPELEAGSAGKGSGRESTPAPSSPADDAASALRESARGAGARLPPWDATASDGTARVAAALAGMLEALGPTKRAPPELWDVSLEGDVLRAACGVLALAGGMSPGKRRAAARVLLAAGTLSARRKGGRTETGRSAGWKAGTPLDTQAKVYAVLHAAFGPSDALRRVCAALPRMRGFWSLHHDASPERVEAPPGWFPAWTPFAGDSGGHPGVLPAAVVATIRGALLRDVQALAVGSWWWGGKSRREFALDDPIGRAVRAAVASVPRPRVYGLRPGGKEWVEVLPAPPAGFAAGPAPETLERLLGRVPPRALKRAPNGAWVYGAGETPVAQEGADVAGKATLYLMAASNGVGAGASLLPYLAADAVVVYVGKAEPKREKGSRHNVVARWDGHARAARHAAAAAAAPGQRYPLWAPATGAGSDSFCALRWAAALRAAAEDAAAAAELKERAEALYHAGIAVFVIHAGPPGESVAEIESAAIESVGGRSEPYGMNFVK